MRVLKAGIVLLSALVLQSAVFAQLDLFGAHADLIILVPIAAGISFGPERGSMAGFVAGIAVDLLVTTPFGLTALAYCMVGYGVGAFQTGVLRASSWLPVVAALAGAAFGVGFWALAATVVGQEGLLNGHLLRIIGVVAVVAAVLVLPAVRLARWVEGEPDARFAGAR